MWGGCGGGNEVRTVKRDAVVLLHGIQRRLALLVRDLCSAPGNAFLVVMHPRGPNLAKLEEELLWCARERPRWVQGEQYSQVRWQLKGRGGGGTRTVCEHN
jgi:hypothetical protein